MLWFFERADESLRLETRYDNKTSEFLVVVSYPDGRERTEQFATLEDFRRCLQAFEHVLHQQHWTGRNGPIVLPYGWPDERLT